MYYFDLDSCFYKYLQTKGIIKINSFNNQIKSKDVDNFKIKEQIEIINEFHNRTLGYTGYMNKRLNNNLGRTIEQYKMYIKWLKRDLEIIEAGKKSGEFNKILYKVGKIYMKKAIDCISNVYENNYICLLKRSMMRKEVCLKNIYFNNLRKIQDKLKVVNLDGCCYNMIEMDGISFLKRLKKKKVEVDIRDFISEFCSIELLDRDSIEFMLSVFYYPYEFMKCCNKYRYKVKSVPDQKYIDELEKIINI